MQITNPSERLLKLAKLAEKDEDIPKVSTCDVSCQTEFDDTLPKIGSTESVSHNFIEFIESSCIVRPDVEVSSRDIEGQYRIWNKIKPKKETFHALKDYLDTRFKHCRLDKHDTKKVVHGYKGITLKPIEYKKNLVSSDVQHFIFQTCKFSPCGTILTSTLLKEFKFWKTSLGKEILATDENDIKQYLKSSEYVVPATVWASDGNGTGYYGLSLKSEQPKKQVSTTGKMVEKREIGTDYVLGKWDTIANAAKNENISAAKMSRCIKGGTPINNYYYCILK